MNTYTIGMRRIAGRVAATVREMNEAHQRMTVLSMSMDRHLPDADKPPATYEEFLLRTSGPLLHEPAARRRARG